MDVPELVSVEDYDPQKARLQASIRWLLNKAFGDNVPADVRDPFYENEKDQLCLKPAVINGLISSDFYCRACPNIFRETSHRWQGHNSVIQALSRKGIYALDPNESAVTEAILSRNSPFKVHSHLSLIESLMSAYSSDVVSVERVVQAVRKFTTVNASSELPYDVEDALMFWLNKVCSTVRHKLDQRQQSQPQTIEETPSIPVLDDLLKDINDGCCLATLISFYCPEALQLSEIALKNNAGIADSLYNIQLIMEFVERHLMPKGAHLNLNDMFHTNEQLKKNLVALLAELFYNFEVNKAPCVRDVTRPFVLEGSEAECQESEGNPTRAKKIKNSGSRPPLPISNATKMSFQQPADYTQTYSSSTPDLHSSALPPARQPLLAKRSNPKPGLHEGDPNKDVFRLRRSHSFTSADLERDGIAVRQSIRAWEDPAGNPREGSPTQLELSGEPQRVIRGRSHLADGNFQQSGSALLANVSIDSDMSLDMTDTSMSLSDFEDTPRRTPVGPVMKPKNIVGPVSKGRETKPIRSSHANDMEIESMSRGTSAHSTRHHAQSNPKSNSQKSVEPLMPAKLKPSKEKSSNHTKEMESGEAPEKKSPTSPMKPLTLNLNGRDAGGSSSSSDTTPEEDYKTPSVENVPFIPDPTKHNSDTGPMGSKTKHFEAFYVDTGQTNVNGPPLQAHLDRHKPQAKSFTLHDHAHTPEAARAAGIPVVGGGSSRGSPSRSAKSRPSQRSSREGMDQELRKLHSDHNDKEVKDPIRESFFLNPQVDSNESGELQRPGTLNVPKPIKVTPAADDKPSPKTCFAQIKKQKDNGEVSPVLYMQPEKVPAKAKGSNPSNPHPKKKTTFAALPNTTTWQESAQKSSQPDSNLENGESGAEPLQTDLIGIRMKLEQRRRMMELEKRKIEATWDKERQKVGKKAFMQVVTKGKQPPANIPEEPVAEKLKSEEIREGEPDSKPSRESKRTASKERKEEATEKMVSSVPPREGSADHRVHSREGSSDRLYQRSPPKEDRDRDHPRRSSRERSPPRDKSSERRRSKERPRERSRERPLDRSRDKSWDREESDRSYPREGDYDGPRGRDSRRDRDYDRSHDRRDSRDRGYTRRRDSDPREGDYRDDYQDYRDRRDRDMDYRDRDRDYDRHGRRSSREREYESRGDYRDRDREPREGTVDDYDRYHDRRDQDYDSRDGTSRDRDRESREYSRDRERVAPLERVQQRLQDRGHSPSPGREDERPRMSREDIQAMIDGGKQRWFKRDLEQEQGKMVRPKSYHGSLEDSRTPPVSQMSRSQPAGTYQQGVPPHPPESQPQQIPPAVGSSENVNEYGSSLDKLNCSLSELQGEIMKLSLDHLKNNVGDSEPRETSTPPLGKASSPPRQIDQFLLYPRESSGEPEVRSSATVTSSAYSQGFVVPPTYGSASHSQPMPHYMAPYGVPPGHPQPPYGMPAGQYPAPGQPFIPGQPPMPGYQQQFPGMAPGMPPHAQQYPGQPGMFQPGMYPHHPGLQNMTGQAQWPSPPQMPPHFSTAAASVPSNQIPMTNGMQQYPMTAETNTVASHQTQISPSTSAEHSYTSEMSSSHSPVSSHGASLPQSMTVMSPPREGGPDLVPGAQSPSVHSSAMSTPTTWQTPSTHYPPPSSNPTTPGQPGSSPPAGPGWAERTPQAIPPPLSQSQEEGRTDSGESAPNEGFFICFESDSPRKQKPKLKSKSKRKAEKGASGNSEPVPSPAVEPMSTSGEPPSIGFEPIVPSPGQVVESAPPEPAVVQQPGSAFVIGEDNEASEFEKKKQRLLMLQEKRKEQQEQKRLKLEAQREKKANAARQKQEVQEKKREDEKSRRETIFQQYLERKAAREAAEEEAKMGVPKRPRPKPKAPRPKSQPPPGGLVQDDKQSHSSQSHSSQEDIRGRSPGPAGDIVQPSVQLFNNNDYPDFGSQLAFGGLTHRRPPSPEKAVRLPVDTLSEAGSFVSQSVDYVDSKPSAPVSAPASSVPGPKLYVKPSSKSNRHIIHNAISHCCLAGTVNNDIKNKVLDELSKSEAKHFIILFRDAGQQYRALYSYYPEQEVVLKIMGNGPKQLTGKMMERFYKYNSGAKNFLEVKSTKHLSVSIDAVTIHNALWQKKAPATKKPPNVY